MAGVVDFPRLSTYATLAKPILAQVCYLKAGTGFFWLGTTTYIAASHLYTSLFIANVRPVDALDLINAIIAGLVQAAAGGNRPRLPRKRVAKEIVAIGPQPVRLARNQLFEKPT